MRLIIGILFGALFFCSCGGDDLPQCVDDRLQTFMTEACETTDSLTGGNLVIYTFKTNTVYCFNWGPCQPDKTVEIWEADCGLLCELGGPTGNEICDGTSWPEFAREGETVFQR